ncbi:MAG: lipoprotein-releasing ABC transporter permease subunit [Pseudomonadota bacterium]
MIKNPATYIGGRYASLRSRNLLVGFISILSVCGLALGVAVLITVLSVMNGFDREMQQRILGLVPHITVTTARNDLLHSEEEWQPMHQAINGVAGVSGTAPLLQLQGMLLANGNTKGILLNAVDPVQEANVSVINQFMQGGNLDVLQPGSYAIAIGSNLAEQLEVAVGDSVTLVSTVVPITPMGEFNRQKSFVVQAIFSVGSQLDANLALVNIVDAQRLYRLGNSIHGYRIQTDDLFAVGEITESLRMVLPEELNFTDWRLTYGNLYENILFSKTLVGLLLSLLVAVAAFNVIVSLIMVVREKQGDIAILRTMGISLGAIRSIFLVQGFIIGLIGTVSGLILGILFSLVVGDAVAWLESLLGMSFLSSEVYPVNYLPSEIRFGDLAIVCSLALLLSLLATVYPAARAARIRPAEILRYE